MEGFITTTSVPTKQDVDDRNLRHMWQASGQHMHDLREAVL